MFSVLLILKKKLKSFLKAFNYSYFSFLSYSLKLFSSIYLFDFPSITNKIILFFNSSRISQLFDDNNIFSEVTQKKKVSPFGLGGLLNKRGNLKLRDIHPSHYGRVCLIETVEGENAGLIFSFVDYI